MNYQEQFLSSSNGVDKLAMSLWKPDVPAKAVVQIVHGMREHMGRYADFATFLTAQGYAVGGHDQLGHGKTVSGSEGFGYFGPKDGCKHLLADCRVVTRVLQKQFPGLPLFVLGHSMGSFVGRIYVLHCARELAGFICMGTGGELRASLFGQALAEVMIRLGRGKEPSRLLDKLAFSSYCNRYVGETAPMAWLSRDKDIVERFEQDEYTRAMLTNCGFRDLLELQQAATSKQWARRMDKTLPVLLVAGKSDPVGSYGKGVVQTYERLMLAGSLDVQCKLYDGARHEILNEINREEVYYDIFRWMEAHASREETEKEL